MSKNRKFSMTLLFIFFLSFTLLVQTDEAYARTSLSQLQAQITALQTQLDALEGQVGVDVSDLQAQIDVIEERVSEIEQLMPPGISGYTIVQISFDMYLGYDDKQSRTVDCPDGTKILGGGAGLEAKDGVYLKQSKPVGDSGWRATWVRHGGGSEERLQCEECLVVYAICGNAQ